MDQESWLGGRVLADGSGLGKTLAALLLVYFAGNIRRPKYLPTLVICPAGMVEFDDQTLWGVFDNIRTVMVASKFIL
jgi:hypothetical protein